MIYLKSLIERPFALRWPNGVGMETWAGRSIQRIPWRQPANLPQGV